MLFTSKGDGSLPSCIHGLDLLGSDLLVEVLGVGSTVIAGKVNYEIIWQRLQVFRFSIMGVVALSWHQHQF